MHQGLYFYIHAICLQNQWLPHNTPLNTAVLLLHPAVTKWESWVEVELWLTPCSRQTVMTRDACNLFSWKCFVAWHGLAAVSISHQARYLSGCVSGNVWVLIGSSEYTRFIVICVVNFLSMLTNHMPIFVACVLPPPSADLSRCVCVWWSHSAVKVPHPLWLTFSLWSVARLKAEHQSKMLCGSALSSWTSSSTGGSKASTIGSGASSLHIAWARCVVGCSTGVLTTPTPGSGAPPRERERHL